MSHLQSLITSRSYPMFACQRNVFRAPHSCRISIIPCPLPHAPCRGGVDGMLRQTAAGVTSADVLFEQLHGVSSSAVTASVTFARYYHGMHITLDR